MHWQQATVPRELNNSPWPDGNVIDRQPATQTRFFLIVVYVYNHLKYSYCDMTLSIGLSSLLTALGAPKNIRTYANWPCPKFLQM